MAHPNIDERRRAISDSLRQSDQLPGYRRKELAEQFGCSSSAIAADVIALTVRVPVSVHTTPSLRRLVRARDGGICQYCGESCGEIIVEHILPASRGGPARPHNLVLACQSCNVLKGSSVWLPMNLDLITAGNPAWRATLMEQAIVPGLQAGKRHRPGAGRPKSVFGRPVRRTVYLGQLDVELITRHQQPGTTFSQTLRALLALLDELLAERTN